MCNPELKERYVNFYTDFAFKKLFGTEVNKELLISFLNSEIANFTPQELSDYRESQKDYWDLFSVVETAENKGIARGLEEGIAIGEERERQKAYEDKLNSARNMKADGLPLATIAKYTGLSEDDIKAL